MSERIKLLVQKRISLKAQITNLKNLLDKDKIDTATLKLRIARLTDLYHAYEEYNDEIAMLDPESDHQAEFLNIQERFYVLANKADTILNSASTSSADNGEFIVKARSDVSETSAIVKKRRIKLPDVPLPTYDGKYENWLSSKNAFRNMIDSQTDLSDVDKLHYLKSALIGEAANKVKIFAIDGINYTKAWELLERSYEVKRVLISQHLSLILNMPALDKETTSGLSRLADDTQQHIAALSALGVSVGPEMIVHILEGKLPKATLGRWEESLQRDEFPKLEQMYEFLYKAAVCASRQEKRKLVDSVKGTDEPLAKRKRNYYPNKVFLLNSSRDCMVCKTKRHPLYIYMRQI